MIHSAVFTTATVFLVALVWSASSALLIVDHIQAFQGCLGGKQVIMFLALFVCFKLFLVFGVFFSFSAVLCRYVVLMCFSYLLVLVYYCCFIGLFDELFYCFINLWH